MAGSRFIVPTNSATNAVAGRSYSSSGRGELLQPAGAHHADPVGHRQRLRLVVGDEDGGDAELELEPADLLAQLHPHLGVERRQRLVEQQHPRAQGERAGQRDPLLLAAGELVRVAVAVVGQADQLQQLGGPARRSALARLRTRRPKATLSATVRFGKRL